MMGTVHVIGILTGIGDRKPDPRINAERIKAGKEPLEPFRLAGVLPEVKEGYIGGVVAVEMMNGKEVKVGAEVDLVCQVYGRGGRPVFVCYE